MISEAPWDNPDFHDLCCAEELVDDEEQLSFDHLGRASALGVPNRR